MEKTIAEVFQAQGSKIINVKFEDGTECMAFADTKFGSPLEKGQTAVAVVESKTSKNSGKQYEQLVQWGEPVKKAYGGGGGKSFVPKSPGAEALMAVSSVTNATGAVVGKMTEFGLLKKPEEVYEALRHVSEALTQEAVDATNKIKGAVA